MLTAIFVAIFAWFDYQIASAAAQQQELISRYQAVIQQQNMISVAEAIEQYRLENNVYPSDLNSLKKTPGFEHISGSLDLNQGYAISGDIVDDMWVFKRAAFFAYDSANGVTQANYLSTNACGTNGFYVEKSWCGGDQYNWFRWESRDEYNYLITTQRARLILLNQKIANYFNAYQRFPNSDKNSVALAPNSNTSLVSLTGYSGNAKECSGQWQFHGIPIDCADMFDIWGGLIGYQFIDDNHVVLTSESPIFNAAGNRIVIAIDRT